MSLTHFSMYYCSLLDSKLLIFSKKFIAFSLCAFTSFSLLKKSNNLAPDSVISFDKSFKAFKLLNLLGNENS